MKYEQRMPSDDLHILANNAKLRQNGFFGNVIFLGFFEFFLCDIRMRIARACAQRGAILSELKDLMARLKKTAGQATLMNAK